MDNKTLDDLKQQLNQLPSSEFKHLVSELTINKKIELMEAALSKAPVVVLGGQGSNLTITEMVMNFQSADDDEMKLILEAVGRWLVQRNRSDPSGNHTT